MANATVNLPYSFHVYLTELIKIRVLLHSSLFREAQKTRSKMALVSATDICVSEV